MANSAMNKKREYLNSLLKQAGCLAKQAQDIKSMDLEASQPTIGNKMQKEVESGSQGNYASDTSVDASIEGTIEVADDKVEGPEEQMAAKIFSKTGNPVKTIKPDGTPATFGKTASVFQKVKAAVTAQMEKQAAYDEKNIVTATEVMQKIASLNDCKTQQQVEALMQDISVDFNKLAAYNPLFNEACERVMMRKMAAEIQALAAAEGIPEEQAAEVLDAATANDPEAVAELENEVQGEALSELADMEGAQAQVMSGLQAAADEVSAITGQEFTPDDIVAAVEDVVMQAEELGVEPEVLINAAAEEMMQGAGDEVTGEDMAAAEQLLEEAAAKGISPEELIQGLTSETPQETPAAEETPAEAPVAAEEEPKAEETPVQDIAKEACLHKLASTRRGANLNYILSRLGR